MARLKNSLTLVIIFLLVCQSHLQVLRLSEVLNRSYKQRRNQEAHKVCGKLSHFLKGVLKAREDLSWLDQEIDSLRETQLYRTRPDLKRKIDSILLQSERSYVESTNEADRDNDVERKKRYSHASYSDHSAGLMNAQIQVANSTIVTAATDVVDKVSKTINVFPVEDNSTIVDRPIRSRRSLKSIPYDLERNQLNQATSSDRENHKSHMNEALSGELAKNIVDDIFNVVKRVSNAKIEIKDPSADAVVSYNYIDNSKNQKDSDSKYINTKSLLIGDKLKKAINDIVNEEVEGPTCAALPPEMNQFLHWLLDKGENSKVYNSEEYSEEPQSKKVKENPLNDDKLEMNQKLEMNEKLEIREWGEKAELLTTLLDQYHDLSREEKNQVQAIHEYLEARLDFVLTYLKILENQ